MGCGSSSSVRTSNGETPGIAKKEDEITRVEHETKPNENDENQNEPGEDDPKEDITVEHREDVGNVANVETIPSHAEIPGETCVKLVKLDEQVLLKIDRHVAETPVEESREINRLSEYLTNSWSTDKEKAFTIFRWVTYNISYDCDGFFGKAEKKSTNAEDVLRNRSSVCAGYANLYKALCNAAGLECQVIKGFAKGTGYIEGKSKVVGNERFSHAWNAVKINDEYHLVDCTWGAGSTSTNETFKFKPNQIFRFMQEPEFLIKSHFPDDEKWQLLDPPVSKDEFELLLKNDNQDFELEGCRMLSHKNTVIDIDSDHLDMEFLCPKDVILSGILYHSEKKPTQGNMVVGLPCGNKRKILVQFPTPGEYELAIFLRTGPDLNPDEDTYTRHGAFTYLVKTTKGIGEQSGFVTYREDRFLKWNFDFACPVRNVISKDGKVEFRLRNSDQKFHEVLASVEEISDGKATRIDNMYCFSEREGEIHNLKVHFPDAGKYNVTIVAKKEITDESSKYLCMYTAFVHKGVEPIAGFPILSKEFHLHGLKLDSHKENIFTKDGKVCIKIKDPNKVLDKSTCTLEDVGSETKIESRSFVSVRDGTLIASCHCPELGYFTFNIFGSTNNDAENKWLLRYKIRSAVGVEDGGFFTAYNPYYLQKLKLLGDCENLVTDDGEAELVFENPMDYYIYGQLREEDGVKQIQGNFCQTDNSNPGITTIRVHCPDKGKFKFRIFGKEDVSMSSAQGVGDIKIHARSSVKPVAGFPDVRPNMADLGIELDGHTRNIFTDSGEFNISLKCPESLDFTQDLKRKTEGVDSPKNDAHVTAKRTHDQVIFAGVLAVKDDYVLNIFAKKDGETKFQFICCYIVRYGG